jgi:hypothetical protein
MIHKQITLFNKQAILACDENCMKAWGINHRPRIQISCDDDDYAFLADSELRTAPADTGVYEGADAKPRTPDEMLNKWCARECERSTIVKIGETIVLPDFSKRVYNQPSKHENKIKLQEAASKLRDIAKQYNFKVLLAQEPGEAARKRREEEEKQ